jgi:hypothetical protein
MAADTPFDVLDTWEKKINVTDIEYVHAGPIAALLKEVEPGTANHNAVDLAERVRRVCNRLRNVEAATRPVSIPDAISEVEKMRDEWLEMKRNYKIDDSLWVAHKNYVNAAMQILDRLRSLSPEVAE